MLVTRWQDIGKTLVTWWQRVGNTLSTRWQHIVNTLATCCQRIGNVVNTKKVFYFPLTMLLWATDWQSTYKMQPFHTKDVSEMCYEVNLSQGSFSQTTVRC